MWRSSILLWIDLYLLSFDQIVRKNRPRTVLTRQPAPQNNVRHPSRTVPIDVHGGNKRTQLLSRDDLGQTLKQKNRPAADRSDHVAKNETNGVREAPGHNRDDDGTKTTIAVHLDLDTEKGGPTDMDRVRCLSMRDLRGDGHRLVDRDGIPGRGDLLRRAVR